MKTWRVYYRKEPTFMVDPNITMDTLLETHQYVASARANTREEVFQMMQADCWSPNGEQRSTIIALHLHHTSMSVGDVLLTDVGNRTISIQVSQFGWKIIPQTRKPIVRNLGAIVGMFQKIANSEDACYEEAFALKTSSDFGCMIHRIHERKRNIVVKKIKEETGLPFIEIGREICQRTSGKWVFYNLNW
jgi:hypothetical protein